MELEQLAYVLLQANISPKRVYRECKEMASLQSQKDGDLPAEWKASQQKAIVDAAQAVSIAQKKIDEESIANMEKWRIEEQERQKKRDEYLVSNGKLPVNWMETEWNHDQSAL